MAKKRSTRPATVPISPASTKRANAVSVGCPIPPVKSTAIQRHTLPTSMLIHTPV